MASKKIRVLIIEESKFVNTLLTGLLSQTEDIEVVGTAMIEDDAHSKIETLKPDIITIDAAIPDFDGIRFIDKIIRKNKIPVIVISTLDRIGSELTIRALEVGAIDYLIKPKLFDEYKDLEKIKSDLVEKIHLALRANIKYHPFSETINKRPINFEPGKETSSSVISITASVGGVEAVKQILTAMPNNSPAVIVCLDLPENMIEALSNRLSPLCEISVQHGKNGQIIKEGNAYLISVNSPFYIDNTEPDYRLTLSDNEDTEGMIFFSLAKCFGKNNIGVILSGKTHNGVIGAAKIKHDGGFIISQDQATCVVYDAPKLAKTEGISHIELPIEDIAGAILTRCA